MDIKALLRRYDIRLSKGLGQNFLTDERVLRRIVEASDLKPTDIVLEIGPGFGSLTRLLADRAGLVVAVELDRKMVRILGETLANRSNVRIVQGDILKLDPLAEIARAGEVATDRGYKVVANLPYYITSAVLRHLLAANRPSLLTIMVQYEVAQRLLAKPGNFSLLAISVQIFGVPRLICQVPAEVFYPQPKIDSAVVRIDVHAEPRVPEQMQVRFFTVARAAFSEKRKQIHNSLSRRLELGKAETLAALQAAEIAPQRRPQTLSIEEWVRLVKALPNRSD